jgi:class 3 adenylate cyclase
LTRASSFEVGHPAPPNSLRTQNVAVLFVDIVGFTAFADARTPEEVVPTLREFHALMEQEVFRHSGTLDKYLSDGLTATFGTPFARRGRRQQRATLCAGYNGGGGSVERRTQSGRRDSTPRVCTMGRSCSATSG